MSTHKYAGEQSWTTPPAEGEVYANGDRYRLTWYPGQGVTKKAVFRVLTDDRRAALEAIVTVRVQQRGESRAHRDEDVELTDIPQPLLSIMRQRGVEPVREVSQ